MANQNGFSSRLFALVIAADCYLLNRMPDGTRYRHLSGCVRDAIRVEEELLKRRLKVPETRILRLRASGDGKAPTEPKSEWPTYENMVARFQQLTEMAAEGDQVYIHYSGHGGRALTAYPELKGEVGIDEALVPIDIGESTARYLRDIELAYILRRMVDKKLIVTIVLDSCHSGGATRALTRNDVAARTSVNDDGTVASGSVDLTPRETTSSVASREELMRIWREQTARSSSNGSSGARSVSVGAGWLPEPEGYVLLAACRPSESALEYAFDNGKAKNGVLTYRLLEALQQTSGETTWKSLHDRIIALIYSQFASQTPQLQGEVNRVLFGGSEVATRYAVGVMSVAANGSEQIVLGAGQVNGITIGAQFAIYPSGTTDFTNVAERLAIVEIIDTGATQSPARVSERLSQTPIKAGDQAVLISEGTLEVRRKVRLLRDEQQLPNATELAAAFESVADAITKHAKGFVEVAQADEAVVYQVAINDEGEYQIEDATGVAFPNLRPALKITAPGAPQRIAERLAHLSKYHAIQQLDNFDSLSPLTGKLLVELFKAPPNYRRGQPPPQNLPSFADPGNTPTVAIGDTVLLRITNNFTQSLNIAALCLQADWGITQFYPPPARGDTIELDANKSVWEPLKVDLPEDYTAGTDLLKVFASIGPANFRWLELPSLDQQTRSRSGALGSPRNKLERLMSELNAEQAAGATRNVQFVSSPSEEWTVASVTINIVRTAASLEMSAGQRSL